jgi:hypothetical protein
MIAADCTVVNDNICKSSIILTGNRRRGYYAHPTPTTPRHSTGWCIGLKNLETVEIRAHLFNFESLLRVIFLRCHCGNVYIHVHISHDLGLCGVWWDEG